MHSIFTSGGPFLREQGMKMLDRIRQALQRSDDFKAQLFAFLGSDAEELRGLGGKSMTRDEARGLLRELIPAEIQMRAVCKGTPHVVAAAPHVSFDNWSEYFCNRVARRLEIGWVVAKNFRDQHPATIPAAIGRHIHVNRPLESLCPGGAEFFSERAQTVHKDYLHALREASGSPELPFDLLLEFHSHQRTPKLEIATVGLTREAAEQINDHYVRLQEKAQLPELALEPLHSLRMTAEATKQTGSLRPEVARCALHIEVPREFRRGDAERRTMCRALIQMATQLTGTLSSASVN